MEGKYGVKKWEKGQEIRVQVPGSKSITNRALLLAALSNYRCTLHGVLFSDDSRAFLECLKKLGFDVKINEAEKKVIVQGEGGRIPNPHASVYVGSAGTAARFLTVMLALADLCVFLMNHYSGNETVNAGTGKELTIKELAELIAKVIGYGGEIRWDESKPNGTPRKLLDVSKSRNLGWRYKVELEEGIRLAYEDFLSRL